MTDPPPNAPEHDHHLAHHFETPQQQYQSGKLGIWLFLATEILLFSGLFCAYAVYRANHPEVFEYAHLYLSKQLGALNTMVLIFSSFTMAAAVRCAQLGKTRSLVVLLGITLVCGFAFLGVKFREYQTKWKEGLLTGASYHPESAPPGAVVPKPIKPPAAAKPSAPAADRTSIGPSAVGPQGISKQWLTKKPPPLWHGPVPYNVQVFFGIYFAMTGLHGVHVLAGLAAIAWVLGRARRGEFGPAYFTPIDFTGLYWHLVDIIWIFLFPLLYLIA
jgi:cytochrome c oxidase subunit III